MTLEERIAEQNEAIRALSAAVCALVDHLHEDGAVDRAHVAERLTWLRGPGAQPIPVIVELAVRIAAGHFRNASPVKLVEIEGKD